MSLVPLHPDYSNKTIKAVLLTSVKVLKSIYCSILRKHIKRTKQNISQVHSTKGSRVEKYSQFSVLQPKQQSASATVYAKVFVRGECLVSFVFTRVVVIRDEAVETYGTLKTI